MKPVRDVLCARDRRDVEQQCDEADVRVQGDQEGAVAIRSAAKKLVCRESAKTIFTFVTFSRLMNCRKAESRRRAARNKVEGRMTFVSRRTMQAMALGVLMVVSGASDGWSQGAPVTGISSVSTYSGTARITAVNPTTRMVSLAFPDGRTASYKVADAVQNLGQVRVGDTIEGIYEERLSFVLSGPNTATPSDREVVAAARAAPGQMPAGAVARQTVVSWTVVRTDVAANTISLVDPGGGQIRTFDVRTAEGRAQLPRVKAGDKLTAISTELILVAVTSKR
jgi:hypothetical protein